jgi:hypothetical protein
MFPDDDRVIALFADARRRFGDTILADPRRSVPLLADQAPELRNTIKAVAGALSIGAAQRLSTTPDQASEFHRLANELVGREGLPMADAMAGVRIAARLAGVGAAARQPEESSWVGGGGTMIAGTPGHTPPTPPGMAPQPGAWGQPGYAPPPGGPAASAQDFMKGKWGVAALVGVAVLVVVGLTSGSDKPEAPPPQAPKSAPAGGSPPPQGGGQPPPQQSAGLPIVVPPGGGRQLPAIPLRDAQQMVALEFGVSANNRVFRFTVGVSKQQGWGAGMVLIASPGAQEPENVSQPGAFRLNAQGGTAIRVLQPQWQRDGLNIGTMCVAFVQQGAQDVQLRGSNVCVLGGNCDQVVGCGAVQ